MDNAYQIEIDPNLKRTIANAKQLILSEMNSLVQRVFDQMALELATTSSNGSSSNSGFSGQPGFFGTLASNPLMPIVLSNQRRQQQQQQQQRQSLLSHSVPFETNQFQLENPHSSSQRSSISYHQKSQQLPNGSNPLISNRYDHYEQQQQQHPIIKNEPSDSMTQISNAYANNLEQSTSSSNLNPKPNANHDPNYLDDDDSFDCDTCINDNLTVKYEYDDTEEELMDETIDCIDISDDDCIEPGVKRMRQLENNNTLSGDPIVEVISFRCTVDGCSDMFPTQPGLREHLGRVHDVHTKMCLMRDCGLEFEFGTAQQLEHIHLAHPTETNWNCSLCERGNLKSYAALHQHFRYTHQAGLFKCGQVDCDYTADFRNQVYIHQKVHKRFECRFVGCDKVFAVRARMRTHERTHLRIKPYCCTWPDCHYASEDRASTVKHIRLRHFQLPATKKEQEARGIVDERNAKDHMKIVKEFFHK